MENAKERVLAYSKAKEISDEEMAEVSGGFGRMTTHMTSGFSGASGQGGEAHMDVSVDW